MPPKSRLQTAREGLQEANYSDQQRTVGQQTVSNDRSYQSPWVLSQKKHEFEEYSAMFYKPHTLISLTLLVGLLALLAKDDALEAMGASIDFTPDRDPSWPSTLQEKAELRKTGAVVGVGVAFVAFAGIHFPNTIMTRPHVLFWRVLLALFCVYAMFLTYLFLLPRDQARQAMRAFDDTLGVELPERSYGEDCRVFTPESPHSSMANISDAVFDVHTVAHFLGWWGKMLIMRDWYVAWACSIGFEICEITFRHWLPNFWECWWDHLFLDLFGCNLIGLILGYYTLKYLSVSKINWVYDPAAATRQDQGRARASSGDACNTEVITSVLDKFKPGVFEKYEWAALRNPRRLISITTMVVLILVVDCNNFFLKFVLWVPAEHDMLKFRVALWGFAALACSKEWYEFCTNDYCHRLGPFSWLAFFTASIETMLVVKNSHDMFHEPFPWYVKVIWTCITATWWGLMFVAWRNSLKHAERRTPGREFNPYNPDLDIIDHGSKKQK